MMRIVISLLVSCVLIFSGCISFFHQGENEIHVAVNGSDLNDGSKAAPLRTIQAAAEKAMPGDTVTVHAGLYREHINPPRGGISDSKRIIYQAAPGEEVIITGSEPAKGWVKESGDTWKLILPNSYFGKFNPFAKAVHGDWFDPRGRVPHLGMVYLNGEWMVEAASHLNEVRQPAAGQPRWYARVDGAEDADYLLNIAAFTIGTQRVEAASFAGRSGELHEAGSSLGGKCIGWIRSGSWLRFDKVDFGTGTDSMEFWAATETGGGDIEVRLNSADGELLGKCEVADTGAWSKWVKFKAGIKPVSGEKNICLVFRSRVSASDNTTIWAQFPGIDPNKSDVEIAKRYTVFTPEKTNIDYITVRGFKLRNAASNWAAPTSGQHGLVTAYWCRGWIIEDNEISYSRCCGIALGKYSDAWDNRRGTQKGYHATIVDALKTGGWYKDKIGGHIVRRNHIHHCGQTGIVGSLGCAFSRVENNEIHDINKQGIWGGAEMAGIKFHGAIDTVISGNHIYRCGSAGGLWLDWMAQGAQVTGNLLHDNEDCDIFTEVNHGPHVIANNILLSPVAYHSCSPGGAYAHNLIMGGLNAAHDGRETPYHKAHSTEVAGRRECPLGDVRWYNNLLAGTCSLAAYDKAVLPVAAAGNVFTKGAQSSKFDEAALLKPDFDPGITLTQQADGWYLELNVDKAWATEQKRRVVGTEMLGKAVIPDLPFENADGSPLKIDTDYFGKKRDTTNPFPGPFEVQESGKQKIKVWPLASPSGAVKQASGASPEAPAELVTQYVTNPMAVDALPHFSWALRDIDRDERQTAYQIIVASTLAGINGDVGNIWDSGKTFSSKSTQVHYVGNPLASDTRYWWKVRTWDKDGNVSPWSAFANFDMGLTTTDWTASHIWDGTDNVNNYAYFRKKFAIPASKTIAIAKLYVSAHDDYNVYINGKQIGIGPAFSNPYKRMYYIGYDITATLSAGDNAITSICHWHGLFRMGGGKSAVPAFILEMRIKYTDGTSQTIKTDNSWKIQATTPWLESPHAFQGISWSDMRCVENYDARKEISGWQTIAFDDSSWANATVVDRSTFILKAQYVATDAVQQILKPVSITQSGSAWIVDFGMCYNGWPRLTMTGNETGSVVTVRYAEVPNDFKDYDTYTCKGGTETWQPDIRYESFRCLKIEGYTGTLTEANIKAAWKYATPDRQGAFTCSNTLFNNIYKLCERSCRQNIQEGVASTDAWRETSSYTADAYLMTGVCLYNYKNSMVLRKTIADYADEQYANGNLDAHCPNSGDIDIPEWTLHWFFLLWNQYLFFGDRDILAENYAVMQKVVDYFIGHQSAATHLLTNTPGNIKISDWPSDPTDNSGASLTAQNCLYYQSLIIASQIAAVLGKEGDSSRYEFIAAKVKTGINTHLFDGVEKYRDCSGSSQYLTLSSCWPLLFDIVPAARKEAVMAYVKNNGFTAHVYGGCWAFDALFHCDQGPYIYSLLNQPSQRWGRMLEPAYSQACWEDWSPVPAGGGMAYNHAWSCYPGRFFLSGVMGICPVAPGYSVFAVKPQVSGLSRASGTVPTIKGNIVVSWTMDGRDFDIKVSVPANCTALVYLPTFGSDSIGVYEGTTLIWRRGAVVRSIPGVSFKTTEPQRLVWQTGSGIYTFKVKLHDVANAAAD